MKILDLFCGAGGASMGYRQALPDAEIVGVDHQPQPNYPFTFIQTNATALDFYDDFDFIHASPPCQTYSTLRVSKGVKEYDDWILPFTQQILRSFAAGGGSYVIENVPGAPLTNPIRLCGSAFPILTTDWNGERHELRRHRLFETSFTVSGTECAHAWPVLGVYGTISLNPRRSKRGTKAGIRQAEELMGIDWMTPEELVQAIPPAYTRHIMERWITKEER